MPSDTQVNRLTQMQRFVIVARLLLWTLWVIYRERRRVIRARSAGDYRARPNIDVLIRVLQAYRTTALRMGGLLIKLGQFLSSRADLLPEQALAVLSDLQDQVPAVPFPEIEGLLQDELRRPVSEVFSAIEPIATAAASLGQVHRAVLAATGETVALKVQRPTVHTLVRVDLSTLRFVIWVITHVVRTQEFIDLNGLYREFRRTVHEELDYVQEAANARRFRDMFENDPHVYIPRVHDGYTTRRMLVLQWVDGIKINDYDALDFAGIDRDLVAQRLVHAYLHQFFVPGFYHADPHPGNIFVQPGDEHGPRIHLVDFGMVGTLTANMQKALRDLFLSYLQKDARTLVSALGRLGFIGRGADIESIERAVALTLDRYYGMTPRQARQLDLGEVSSDIEDLLYGQPFQVPTRFAFTGRAIGTLVGVTTGLAPEFNFVESATPYARQFLGMGEGDGAEQAVQQVLQQLGEVGTTLLRLPKLLERVAGKLESGQLEINLGTRKARGRRAERAASEAGWVWLASAQVAAGAALLVAGQTAAGWFCLGASALLTVWKGR